MHISWILLNVFNVHGKGEEIFWAHFQYTEFLMKEYHQDPLYGNGRRKGWLFSSVLFCCWRSRDKRDMLFEEGFSQFVFRNERFLERDFFLCSIKQESWSYGQGSLLQNMLCLLLDVRLLDSTKYMQRIYRKIKKTDTYVFLSKRFYVIVIELCMFEYIQNILNICNESRYEQERKIQLKHLGFELHNLRIVEIFQIWESRTYF